MSKNYDFCGWATKNDLRCTDGRIIRKDAFKENDGRKVPLIWNHNHTSPSAVIGHAMLQNLSEGVFAYCFFNNSRSAMDAKEAVQHGDIDQLSIYANHLQQRGSDVLHGMIREVSLVHSGANPGARIEDIVQHMDGEEEEAIIFTGETLELFHADDKEEEKEDKKEDEDKKDDGEETVQDIIDTMNDKQKTVLFALVGNALEEGSGDKEAKHSDEGDYDMKHNLFEGTEEQGAVLSHSDIAAIFADARESGSLRKAVDKAFLEHGITVPAGEVIDDYLFPEAKNLNVPPEFIKREDSWVSKVMNGTHHTPFSRIRSMFADITADEARARGYVKGNQKVEEVFSLLKRETTPQTVYKLQKMDRDDVIDITSFDVVAWLKAEMRMMLNEEIARAVLVGDGRNALSTDKIKEDNIRPIWTDNSLFTINKVVTLASSATDTEKGKAYIKAALKARKDYKGSGNPTFFTTEDILTDMLLIEDLNGRRIYESITALATAMRVKEIVTVPVMENLTRTVSGTTRNLIGLIVNLDDYNIGADKGGAVSTFEDFDINFNKYEYLIETRCSGALTKPYSAIALEAVFQ